MSYNNISESLSVDQKAAFNSAVQDIKASLPFLINLTATERKKLRKTGAKRLSYITDIYNATLANPLSMPASINIAEFGKDVTLFKDMNELMNYLKPLYEAMEDTLLAVGSEAIAGADEAYAHLKLAAQKKTSNQNLKSTVQKISDQLKHKSIAKDNPAT
jgi:late competence protein required for DNA uptake (superfamily II DNA/RNA helicase)